MEWFSYKWLNMSHIFTVGSINLTFRLTEFDEMLMVRLGKLFYHSSCQERMALLSVYIDGYYFHLVFFFSSFVRYTHTQANVSRVSSHLNKKKVIFLCISIFIHVIWKSQGSDKIEKSWFLGDCICIHCKLQAVQVSTCRQHYTRQHTYQNY